MYTHTNMLRYGVVYVWAFPLHILKCNNSNNNTKRKLHKPFDFFLFFSAFFCSKAPMSNRDSMNGNERDKR